MGGLLDYEIRHRYSTFYYRVSAIVIVGLVIVSIIIYLIYASMLIKRVRIDSRGILFLSGKSMIAKMSWKNVANVRCYEREGGITLSKTIRGIEFKSKIPDNSFLENLGFSKSSLKMESDNYGQESLDKTVAVVRFYKKKYDFDTEIDEWEKSDKYMFSKSSK